MSQYVSKEVDKRVNPWTVPEEKQKSIEMKSKFINEGTKLYYPSVNGEVIKENINEAQQNYKSKREQRRLEKEQQKHIENIRLLEQKRQELKRKQLEEQEALIEKQKKQEEPRLFDSIRDDINNQSNNPPKLRGEKIIPAVDTQKQEPEVITPVMNKPTTNSNATPAANKKTSPAQNTQTTNPETTKQQNTNTQQQPKKLPQYDWNIKNINLQKIGNM